MTRQRIYGLSIILFLVGPVTAQEEDVNTKKLLSKLTLSVDQLLNAEKIGDLKQDEKAKFAKLWLKLTDDIDTLDSFRGKAKVKPSDEYIESLKLNHDALSRVYEKDLKADEKLEICGAISKDLEIKNEFAKKNAKEGFSKIKVCVITKDGENEKKGYEVWYVPAAWDKVEKKYKRYDKNSSPTTQSLAPGAYMMWAQTANAKAVGKKQPFSIGENGDLEQGIDLPVPPEK